MATPSKNRSFSPETVLNGTFGEVWVNDEYMSEAIAFKAAITLNKEEVKMTGTLKKGYKYTGTEGKGELKLHKVTSRFLKLISDNIKKGKTTVATIQSNIADPDALDGGNEMISISDAVFDEVTLADWEAGKLGEETIPFTFGEWEINDVIG